MTHQFDTDIACKYGIEAAILLQNIYFWTDKNRANDKHFHDGHFWTYNSVKAYKELFSYMSESTIRRALKKLEDDGVILTGNYNQVKYDHTNWYAITSKGYALIHKTECQKENIDLVKKTNRSSQNNKPIPDSKPVNKPDTNIYSEIETAYIDAFKEVLPNGEPIIDYKKTRAREKVLLSRLGKDKILQAINAAKKDDWIISGGFSLMVILGDYQLNKLLNGKQQKHGYSKPLPVQTRTTFLDMED